MIEFYIKVPPEKEQFFMQLIHELGYDFERIVSTKENEADLLDDIEEYFTDDDI